MLLALAGACAALLLAAPVAPSGDQCVNIPFGNKSNTMVTVHLDDIVETHVTVEIPHRCEHTALVGQQLSVCDRAAPQVAAPAWPSIGPVTVRRARAHAEPACAVVYQYCADAL